MKSFHLLRTSALSPFVKFLDNLGSPVDRLLEQHKLNRDLIFDPNAYCIERQFWLFIEGASRLEGSENLGSLVGLNYDTEDYGTLGKIAMQKPNLEKSLQTISFSIGKHYSRFKNKIHLTINPTVAKVGFQKLNLVDYLGHQYIEQTMFFAIYKLIQDYLGEKGKLCQFYTPDIRMFNYWRSFSLFDEQQWHLSNTCYAITFPSNLLYTSGLGKKLKIPQSDVESWISSQPPESFAEKVTLLMPFFVAQGIIKITEVADLIGMSERTLLRRFENSGTSYAKILEQNRFAIAKQKLINENISIAEISLYLGYDYPEHFSRAFKRWSGMSPLAFRQNLSRRNLDFISS